MTGIRLLGQLVEGVVPEPWVRGCSVEGYSTSGKLSDICGMMDGCFYGCFLVIELGGSGHDMGT